MYSMVEPIKWLVIFLMVPVAALAFGAGIFVGFIYLSARVKQEIRRHMSLERYDAEPLNWYSETRTEKRQKSVTQTAVSIRAPVFDSAGVPMPGEENIFSADLIDFSRRGISILSPTFLPEGSYVRAGCHSKEIYFEYNHAKVIAVKLAKLGLRISLQFVKPIDIIT